MLTFLSLPWVELCIALPLVGSLAVGLIRDTAVAGRWTLAVCGAVFACSLMPWFALQAGVQGNAYFAVDGLTAPLLPLVALLHLLVVSTTARVKLNRMSLGGHLIADGIRLGMFAAAPSAPWTLILFIVLGIVPPWIELRNREKSAGLFITHMLTFCALLVVGWGMVEAGKPGVGTALLFLAVLVRSGTFPMHMWVPYLAEHATFGTTVLFLTPLAGVFIALRLVLPIAPDWVLQGIGIMSLVTAVYAAGMATVQVKGRRFFAYLFLSHASMVLVGLELHTAISLTGALCLWVSVSISLGGLGITMRAVEARFGRLSLAQYRGLYDQSPALAVAFLVTALGSVGFPGTLGFVAAELLIDGAIEANLFVGVTLVLVAALNGIAVLRAYFLLFTGCRHKSAVPLGITPRESFAVLLLVALILGGGLYPQPGIANRHAAVQSLIRSRLDHNFANSISQLSQR
jgi:NADH-quinone oxidoreductase subunit M